MAAIVGMHCNKSEVVVDFTDIKELSEIGQDTGFFNVTHYPSIHVTGKNQNDDVAFDVYGYIVNAVYVDGDKSKLKFDFFVNNPYANEFYPTDHFLSTLIIPTSSVHLIVPDDKKGIHNPPRELEGDEKESLVEEMTNALNLLYKNDKILRELIWKLFI